MKQTIINVALLITGILISASVSAQSSVWATTNSIETVRANTEFQYLESHLGIEISKPLSNSRQSHLQQVYEFSCNCDGVELYTSMHKVQGISDIEYGPKYENLNEPNDYALYNNWNNGTNSAWHLDLINAQIAWGFTHGNTPIAISDQNYWVNHEDLIGKILHYDTTNTSSQGHGTAVATLAGANTNNGQMVSSIGYDSPLGLYRMSYNEVLAATYDGYKVINMSWTSGCNYNQYIQDAITEVYNNGTFLVAAAGNGTTCGGPTELVYPAAHDNVYAVSSVDHNDSHDNGSNLPHQYNSSVDLCAPGYNVPITAAPGWILQGSGTSYASPIVAGAVSLMLSVNPDLTNQEIEDILNMTAQNIDNQNPSYIGMLGSGRLNAGGAVEQTQRFLDIANHEEEVGDGNNGHGNDEDGVDPSNPGQGNGNNGNDIVLPIKPTKPGTTKPGTTKPGGIDSDNSLTKKNVFSNILYYDMSGKIVNLETASSGIYLMVEDGVVINKIWK